jgi:hypothetical protein
LTVADAVEILTTVGRLFDALGYSREAASETDATQ